MSDKAKVKGSGEKGTLELGEDYSGPEGPPPIEPWDYSDYEDTKKGAIPRSPLLPKDTKKGAIPRFPLLPEDTLLPRHDYSVGNC